MYFQIFLNEGFNKLQWDFVIYDVITQKKYL